MFISIKVQTLLQYNSIFYHQIRRGGQEYCGFHRVESRRKSLSIVCDCLYILEVSYTLNRSQLLKTLRPCGDVPIIVFSIKMEQALH